MHEMSLAFEICRLAEAKLGPAARDVTRVALVVGDQAGIEAGNLEFWLDEMLSRPPFGRGRPLIRTVPGDALEVEYLEVDDGRTDD